MKRALIYTSILALTVSAHAEEFKVSGKSQLLRNSDFFSEEFSKNSIRVVEVTGMGETPEAARTEAARQAVQQVAGVFVDAKRKVETRLNERMRSLVEEQVISYTNAFIAKFEVLSMRVNGNAYEVRAKVAVAVEPVRKMLESNNLAASDFDTDTGSAIATTRSDEKKNAAHLYNDLIENRYKLIKVAVGKGEVLSTFPAPAESSWLSIPITFLANDDAIQEWHEKFSQFGDLRAKLELEVSNEVAQTTFVNQCQTGQKYRMTQQSRYNTFLSQDRVATGYTGAGACFITSTSGKVLGSTYASADCYGRMFYENEVPNIDYQRMLRGEKINLIIDFLGKEGNHLDGIKANITSFPELALYKSQVAPLTNEKAFFNYCGRSNGLFFQIAEPHSEIQFPNTIIFPPRGSRISGTLNVQVPNEFIAKVSKITARIEGDNP